jgi:hypothetical protein
MTIDSLLLFGAPWERCAGWRCGLLANGLEGGGNPKNIGQKWKGRHRFLELMTAKKADNGSRDLTIELWTANRRCADELGGYYHNRVM